MNKLWIMLIAATFVSTSTNTFAQDAKPKAPAAPAPKAQAKPKAPAPDSPKGKFLQAKKNWDALQAELGKLQQAYPAAKDDAERAAIKKAFDKAAQSQEPRIQAIFDTAQAAYFAAPNKDKELTQIVAQITFQKYGQNEYAQAIELADKLITLKHPAKELLEVAVLSAMALDKPKLVDGYLAKAKAAGSLDALISRIVGGLHGQDKYQAALKFIDKQIANKQASPKMNEIAGMCAFALDQFDKADKYFATAKALGPLTGQAAHIASQVVDHKKFWAVEQKVRQAEAKADNLPRVKIVTNKGEMILELYEDQAPNTVASFLELVGKKFYDGVVFHRVLPNFMAQGGDPTGSGSGGPGYNIKCECYRKDYRKHFRGTLSMAHAGRDTGGSQFFITFGPTAGLNGKHTAFGRVIKGIDVLAKLQRRNPSDPQARGITPDKIVTATIVRKRDHAYKVEKRPGR